MLSSQENKNNIRVCTSSLVHVFKSAGDGLRVDILRVLKQESFGVQELAYIFDMPQPGMSHHLKVLSKAGLIASRREGNSLFYRRPLIQEASPLRDLLQSVYSAIDQIPQRPEILDRVRKITNDRSLRSKEFFQKNAAIFAEEQGRIVNFDQYRAPMQDLINQFPHINKDNALEIGPGDGELLIFLAKNFSSVVAIDNSMDMLRRAERAIKHAGIQTTTFVHGEIFDLSQRSVKFDLIAMNMVLHHMASPQEIFRQLKHLLNEDGILLVAELCQHNQDWVRSSCGDLWLGFNPDELDAWASDQGFKVEHSLYFGMKNGFQIQLKAFSHKLKEKL